jgi:hypothetical protein
MINTNIADFISFFHIILVFYVFVGFYFTPIQYLKYYLYLIIFIFLDWNDFDGQCILTRLEHYFRSGQWKQKPSIEDGAPEFFRPMMKKIFNLDLTRHGADKLNNFLFMSCFLFGFIRLVHNYNI